ncbi:MAG: hypothetical protein Q4D38_06135 [Planctomycetia bacterium]|nr:hypothetical protein [Planctomycetia bacterium]
MRENFFEMLMAFANNVYLFDTAIGIGMSKVHVELFSRMWQTRERIDPARLSFFGLHIVFKAQIRQNFQIIEDALLQRGGIVASFREGGTPTFFEGTQ